MCGKMGLVDWIAFILLVVGGINWGLVGFFNYDLVNVVFGNMTVVSRIVYGLVGLSALYWIYYVAKCCKA